MVDMHKLYWDLETHTEFEKRKAEFKEKFGHDVAFKNIRNDASKYHLNVLCAFLKKLKGDDLTVLEIGSYMGDSARIFSGYFNIVEAVDPFGKNNELSDIDDLEEKHQSDSDKVDVSVKTADENDLIKFVFEKNLVGVVDNVKFHNMTSDDFFLKYRGERKFDFIYIDGDHRYSQQMRDYTNALEFLNEDGVVGGHDWSWDGTQDMIRDMGFAHKPMIHFLDDSFLIIPEELL